MVHPHPGWPGHNAPFPAPRHFERCNIGFLDGHVKSMKIENIEAQQTTEDGIAVTGNDTLVLWNKI